jgi:hypothetical protein
VGCGIISSWASTVWERTRVAVRFRYTTLICITPVCWDVAIVVFQVVDTPCCECCCIERLVAYRSRVSSAGCCASIAIDADFEAESVDAACRTIDSGRKLGGIGNELISGTVSS